jgi:hypothetical protein
MALNFPSSPTEGQIYYDPVSGNRYSYNTASGVWRSTTASALANTSDKQVLFNNNGQLVGNNGLVFDTSSNTFYANTVSARTYAGAGVMGEGFTPGGRLTLVSGQPIMTANTVNAATIYYTSYNHDLVPIWNGTQFIPTQFTETSQALTDSTKSPAATTAANCYDMFVWSDSGTIRCTRGPAWTNTINRGTGTGTSELNRQKGVLVNKFTITNGPAANSGTYVGTIYTHQYNKVDWVYGGTASGGTPAILLVWNAYNRMKFIAASYDNGSSYTYSSSTVRPVRNSYTCYVAYVLGLDNMENIDVVFTTRVDTAATTGSYAYQGISYDVWNSLLFRRINYSQAASTKLVDDAIPGMFGSVSGLHFIAAVEAGDNSTTCTYSPSSQQLLYVSIWM